MAKTLLQIQQQIAELKAVEERLRLKEAQGVISRIREAIAVYALTPEDLFGAQDADAPKTRRKLSASAEQPQPKFSDGAGNTWSGRGRKPGWLVAAVAGGKSMDEFRSDRALNKTSDAESESNAAAVKPKRSQKAAASSKVPNEQKRRSKPVTGLASETESAASMAEGGTLRKKAGANNKRHAKVAIKYRDGENSWSGRGSQPRWLKAALTSGKSIENFAV